MNVNEIRELYPAGTQIVLEEMSGESQIPYGKGDIQFFPTFPHEGIFLCFPQLHFAAYKFPQQSSCLMSRTLANQKTVTIPNEGRYHFCHNFFLRSPSICFHCTAKSVANLDRSNKKAGIPKGFQLFLTYDAA